MRVGMEEAVDQQLLDNGPQRVLGQCGSIKASLVVANTAITTFKYRDPADVSLGNFNAHPHLTDRALVTLR